MAIVSVKAVAYRKSNTQVYVDFEHSERGLIRVVYFNGTPVAYKHCGKLTVREAPLNGKICARLIAKLEPDGFARVNHDAFNRALIDLLN